MKKYLIPFISCILVGFLLAYFMLNQYNEKPNLNLTFNKSEKLYFIQYGVYSSVESMEKNTLNLGYYIYNKQDDLYYVFIAITKDLENLEKLKGYFKELGYNIYVKEFNISNQKFIENLENHDALLKEVTSKEAITSIITQTLEKYEEIFNEH